MRRVRAAMTFLGMACVLGFGPAQADVQVNSYTTSSQYKPSVAADADGSFVVVWASLGSDGTDSDGFSIQGQRFAADGSMTGAQFQVNTYTTTSQGEPDVAMDGDGDFTVVWTSGGSAGTDSSSSSIQGQRFASDGTAVAAQFQVNTYTTSMQIGPRADMDTDGDLVVVWTSLGSDGTDSSSYSVQGRRYASDGSTVASQFQVNTFTSGEQTSAAVAVDSDGDFVVAWRSGASAGADTSADSVQGQRFASDGSAVGAQIEINTYTTGVQTSPAVDMDADGDFVVAWQSAGSDGGDSDAYSIQGQRFASNGSKQGAQIQINTFTTSLQFDPSVGMDSDGDFTVVWNSFGSAGTDTSDSSIQSQRYASDGSAVGSEIQVNSYTTGFQDSPIVAVDSDGDFVVVWTSSGSAGTDSSGYSIQSATFETQADLVITKTDSPDPVVAGQNVTYTISVTNNGPSDAAGVVVTDTLPVGVTATATAGDCAEPSPAVPTCTLGTIASGASKQYTLTAAVGSGITGSITNSAAVTATTTLINTGDDSAVEVTSVNAVADLAILKTDSQDPVSGNTFSYTLQVTNLGPSEAMSVVATDPLPAGLAFAGSAGGCTEAAGTVTCPFGNLAPGASASRSFDVVLDPPFAASVTNAATVSSASPDPVPENDTGSETTVLDTVPPVVANVDTRLPNGDGTLMTCEVVRSQVFGLIVDLTDDLSPVQGAADPSAFLLVSTGPDGTFSTTDCVGGVAGDDVQIQIIDLAVENADPLAVTSRFNLVSSFGLAPGLYRFLTCDTITDGAGNALDGDGDGTAGGDLRLDFRADPLNFFLNGNFDACAGPVTLSPWIATSTPPNAVEPSAAGQDASGSPLSGSAEISHLQDGSSSLGQCVPIDRVGTLDMRAQLRFSPAGEETGILRAGCEFFDAPSCAGSSLGLRFATSILEDLGPVWQPLEASLALPPGVRSGLCAFTLEPMLPTLPTFDLGLDALFIGDSLIFRDGFESGNTSAWTQSIP
ncbi:MAG: hypothetical protein MI919_08230 [Holophagales bacterium]|nr:hypothetical protein [Holophagales bacterium]